MPDQNRREPRWLTRAMVVAMQEAQIREHGGLLGIRDEAMIESALARPRNKFEYAPEIDVSALAAAYAFGLAKNHGFIDGNKRAAFTAAYVFLGLNGYDLTASEAEVASIIRDVAAGEVTETELAAWIRRVMIPEHVQSHIDRVDR